MSVASSRTASRSGPLIPAFLLLMAAIAASVAGGALAAGMLTDTGKRVAAPGQAVDAAGLSLRVEDTLWLNQEAMPGMGAGAMAGMPLEGQRRLSVAVAFSNEGKGVQQVGVGDFRLVSGEGATLIPVGSNFKDRRLGPGQMLTGAVYFDVPDGTRGLSLVWSKGNTQARVSLSDAPAYDARQDQGDHGHS